MTKNVLITGATRGLGLATASRLLEDGYRVIATGRSPSAEFKELLSKFQASDQLMFKSMDLSRTGEIHNFVKACTAEYGHLYGLINNAAIGLDGVLATMHESEIASVINTNLTSTIILTKYAVRSMLMQGEGRIINISSIIASTGFNGLSVYAASKAGLIGFTKSLARELGKAKITVNAIAPGFMETQMTSGLKGDKLESIKRRTPLNRLANVADVANGVSFLLRPESYSITGTTLTIDAGSTC